MEGFGVDVFGGGGFGVEGVGGIGVGVAVPGRSSVVIGFTGAMLFNPPFTRLR
jgi:hypothetical protein